MFGGYSQRLKFFGVVLVGGIVSLPWTSSFGTTDLNISPRLRGYTVLQRGRNHLGWYRKSPTPIEFGRVDIFLFKGQTGYAIEKSG